MSVKIPHQLVVLMSTHLKSLKVSCGDVGSLNWGILANLTTSLEIPLYPRNYSISMLAQDRLQNTKPSVRLKQSFSNASQFC
jgi:hypothetical protein